MTQITMFEQLCAIGNTIERLAQSQTDGPMRMALESIIRALDDVIDESVEAQLIEADAGAVATS